MKKLIQRLKSKTYWFAGSVGVLLPLLESNLPLLKQAIMANHAYLYFGISVGIAFLREITKEPVSAK